MTDRPILFTAEMVRALIAGCKTKTRRIAKARRGTTLAEFTIDAGPGPSGIGRRLEVPVDKLASPYAVGDRLWVREAWRPVHSADPSRGAVYRADVGRDQTKWKPGIHMFRWASRLTLTVTSVGLERLQEITDDEARAEGVDPWPFGEWFETSPGETINQGLVPPRVKFAALWRRIHGRGSWNDNPWVHVVGFDVALGNIDASA